MSKKTETRPSTGHINPFGLRMQPELRQKLEAAANEAGRSLNSEIVARLELSFGQAAFGADWESDLAVKFRELINPALVEMSKIENETRLKLAVSGLTQEEIAKAMAIKVDPAEVQKKRAGKGSKKP